MSVMRRHAHPKWRDDLRLVGECAAFVVVLFLVVAAASVTPS